MLAIRERQQARVREGVVRGGSRPEVDDSLLFHGVTVRPGAKLRRVIADKWTEFPPGVHVGFDRAQDEKHFTVTPSGITIVPSRHKFA